MTERMSRGRHQHRRRRKRAQKAGVSRQNAELHRRSEDEERAVLARLDYLSGHVEMPGPLPAPWPEDVERMLALQAQGLRYAEIRAAFDGRYSAKQIRRALERASDARVAAHERAQAEADLPFAMPAFGGKG